MVFGGFALGVDGSWKGRDFGGGLEVECGSVLVKGYLWDGNYPEIAFQIGHLHNVWRLCHRQFKTDFRHIFLNNTR